MSAVTKKERLFCSNCGNQSLMLAEEYFQQIVHCISDDQTHIIDPMEAPVRVDDTHADVDGKIEIRKSFLAPVEIERRLYLFCSCCGEMYLPIFRYEPNGTKILRGEKIKDGLKV